jgi:hypothetical protein
MSQKVHYTLESNIKFKENKKKKKEKKGAKNNNKKCRGSRRRPQTTARLWPVCL